MHERSCTVIGGITADSASRLARHFGNYKEFRMNLASNHEFGLRWRVLYDSGAPITLLEVA